MDSKVHQVVGRLVREHTTVSEEIRSDTQVYYDLKIWGDDFSDLLDDIEQALGVSLRHIRECDYVPQEGFNPLLWLFPKKFKSLSVSELAKLVSESR